MSETSQRYRMEDWNQRADNGRLNEILAGGNTAHAQGHVWSPSPGHRLAFESKYYPSLEESEEAAINALRSMGYTPPRWWQWWRWGENKPSERILRGLGF